MNGNFSERVRNAMQAPTPGEHPSADVLNSYAERVLPAAEAQAVLQHLAVCAACREIVYLASAAEEETAPVLVPVRRTRWWKWAVPVAAALLIASAVVLPPNFLTMHGRRMAKMQMAAAPRSSEKATNEPVVTPQASAPEKPARAKARSKQAAEPRRDFARNQESGQVTISSAAKGTMPAETKAAPSPQVAVAPAAPEATEADALDKTMAGKPSLAAGTGGGEFGRNRTTLAGAMVQPRLQAKKERAAALWRVTPNGTLERSVGGIWQPPLSALPGKFVAVSSVGNEVWAAAKGLALYHSGDGGAQWERLALPSEVSGEIVQVAFTSSVNGVLQTSSGESWTTQDGGKTWSQSPPTP